MNGDTIISREIGDDIEALNKAKPAHRDCELARAVVAPIKRALRMGEQGMKFQKLNFAMFVVIMAQSVKIKDASVMEWLLQILGSLLGPPG